MKVNYVNNVLIALAGTGSGQLLKVNKGILSFIYALLFVCFSDIP